jgi:hypothetical protein
MAHDEPAASGAPAKLAIKNVGLMLSGDLKKPILDADTILAVDGRITAVRRHYKSSVQFTLRSTTNLTRNVISSPAKSTNRDARLRWPNGAQSWPDPHLEFLSRQTHTVVVHRSRFCLTRPSWAGAGALVADPVLAAIEAPPAAIRRFHGHLGPDERVRSL